MDGQLRRQLVDALPEPMLRRLQRLRHGENPFAAASGRPAVPRRARPQTVTEFDAHAAHADVLTTVTSALDKAGVEFVLVPGPHGSVHQVGVDADDRKAAIEAVRSAACGPGWALRRADGRRSRLLDVHQVLAAPSGQLLSGWEPACRIGFWTRVSSPTLARPDGDVHAVGTRIAPPGTPVTAYLAAETWDRAVAGPAHWPLADPHPDVFELREPVDLVYTWVDGDDPDWQRRKAAHQPDGANHNYSAYHPARFADRDELKYSLRSVAMYASWVRHIYVVTDEQVPPWLDVDHPKLTRIDHRDIFRDPGVLPVFNSHAIESQLHHIPGLAEHYVYLNDDMFFGRPVEPELFFHGNGIAKFFLSRQTLDLDPRSLRDLPATSAAKHNRELLERDFGVSIRHKLTHGMYPQLRSVLEEIEQRYPELFAQVAGSRFRHPDDHSIVSSLQQYYAYVRGRAVPGDLRYRYQDISRANTPRRLDEILRERPQIFCINDVDSPSNRFDRAHQAMRQFFDAYFPLPSPFEKDSS